MKVLLIYYLKTTGNTVKLLITAQLLVFIMSLLASKLLSDETFSVVFVAGMFLVNLAGGSLLIVLNLLDTGSNSFSPVALSPTSCFCQLSAKLITSLFWVILMISLAQLLATLLLILTDKQTEPLILQGKLQLFYQILPFVTNPKLILAALVLIAYITYPIIWSKAVAPNFPYWLAIIIILLWITFNSVIEFMARPGNDPTQRTSFVLTEPTLPLNLLWHLVWCTAFFNLTVRIQEKKVDYL